MRNEEDVFRVYPCSSVVMKENQMAELTDVRLCRKCSIVTTDNTCPLCDAKTIVHPERKCKKYYCCDCADQFPRKEIVVRTWHDGPYCQCDDGMLITVCRPCAAKEAAEYDCPSEQETARESRQ